MHKNQKLDRLRFVNGLVVSIYILTHTPIIHLRSEQAVHEYDRVSSLLCMVCF